MCEVTQGIGSRTGFRIEAEHIPLPIVACFEEMEERQQERIQEKLQQRWGIRSFAGFPDFFLIFMCDLCYSGTEMHEDVCCTHRRNEIDDLNNRKLAASFAEVAAFRGH